MILMRITLIFLFAVLAATAAVAAEPQPGRADGRGGLAGLTPNNVEALRPLRETLKQLATDPREPPDNHRRALAALARVHEALDDWGQDGQIEWCLHLMEDSKRIGDLLTPLAVAAAKGGTDHLGGVRLLLDRLEAGDADATHKWRRCGQLEHLCREMPKHHPHMAAVIPGISLQAKGLDPQGWDQ